MNPLAGPYLYGLQDAPSAAVVDAYVTSLVCVARANGIVQSESRVIAGIAEILGAMPFTVSRAMAGGGDLGAALAVLAGDSHLVALLYRDAILVARADGVTSAEEEVTLMQIATQLGVTRAQREAATAAADLLSQVRQTMTHL